MSDLPRQPSAPIQAAAAAPQSFAGRQGYQPRFLGPNLDVPLPAITGPAAHNVLTFTDPATGRPATELKYTHFSVVMNAARRLCFYSAVNIDGKQPVPLKGKRPGWRIDPRIPKKGQVLSECYGSELKGKFSRGHMTRREDPNWGPDAAQANIDTFHAPNACPQIQPFNAGTWNNLEDYALRNAQHDAMRISVITGPVFDPGDPLYFGVAVPVRFWKVIAFIHDQTGRLCATGYTMSQRERLAGLEFVFGGFLTYQVRLAEIEALTGLSFGDLPAVDPLKGALEALPAPLMALEQIRFV